MADTRSSENHSSPKCPASSTPNRRCHPPPSNRTTFPATVKCSLSTESSSVAYVLPYPKHATANISSPMSVLTLTPTAHRTLQRQRQNTCYRSVEDSTTVTASLTAS